MNAFVEHHKKSIQFGYRCFDRLLLNGLIQPFQQPERVLGFFNTYRQGRRVTRKTLTEIADQFLSWLKDRTAKWGIPLLEDRDGHGDGSRRDRLLDEYFQHAKPNQLVAVLKAREPARILLAIGDKNNDRPHLEYKRRWVNQFNLYGAVAVKWFFLVAAQRVERLELVFRAVDPPLEAVLSSELEGRSSSRRLRSGSRSRDRNASGARRRAAVAQLVFRSALTPEHAQGRWTARRAFREIASASCVGVLSE